MTAASYLIILQSLEPASAAKQHATLLFDAALGEKWNHRSEIRLNIYIVTYFPVTPSGLKIASYNEDILLYSWLNCYIIIMYCLIVIFSFAFRQRSLGPVKGLGSFPEGHRSRRMWWGNSNLSNNQSLEMIFMQEERLIFGLRQRKKNICYASEKKSLLF